MKQTIEPEQWDELTPEQKDKFWDSINKDDMKWGRTWGASGDVGIGVMIEFLGDDWPEYLFDECMDGYHECPYQNYKGELCDALWIAVKEKLK